MLSMVGTPVAVNSDRALRLHARRNGWTIRDYRTARRVVKSPAPAVGIAGLVTGIAVVRPWRRAIRADRADLRHHWGQWPVSRPRRMDSASDMWVLLGLYITSGPVGVGSTRSGPEDERPEEDDRRATSKRYSVCWMVSRT